SVFGRLAIVASGTRSARRRSAAGVDNRRFRWCRTDRPRADVAERRGCGASSDHYLGDRECDRGGDHSLPWAARSATGGDRSVALWHLAVAANAGRSGGDALPHLAWFLSAAFAAACRGAAVVMRAGDDN